MVIPAVLIFVALAVDQQRNGLRTEPFIGSLSLGILDGTLGKLPSCDDEQRCDQELRVPGDTDENMLRIVSLAFGLSAAAGFAYAFAVALTATHGRTANGVVLKEDADSRRKAINNISLLAAITFLSTIVVAQFLFEPGKLMLDRAVSEEQWENPENTAPPLDTEAPDEGAEGERTQRPSNANEALDRYQHFRNAMTFYWAVVFSMALAATFFPALVVQSIASGEELSVDSMWVVTKNIISVLTPVIGTGLFSFGAALLEHFTAS